MVLTRNDSQKAPALRGVRNLDAVEACKYFSLAGGTLGNVWDLAAKLALLSKPKCRAVHYVILLHFSYQKV